MNVLGLAGRKRSGKDSSAKYFIGRLLVKNDIIERFDIDNDGNLLVNYQSGEEIGMGIFDIDRRDPAFVGYCAEMIWPVVKNYHFADELKTICMNLYGLTEEQCFGTTEQKESETSLIWNDFYGVFKKTELIPKGSERTLESKMTSREVLQTVSDMMKKVNAKCWCDCLLRQIKSEQVPNAIISDIRYDFEVDAIKSIGGKVIYLTRSVSEDSHSSENGFVDYDMSNFDAIIDNKDLSMADKNNQLDRILQEFGYL